MKLMRVGTPGAERPVLRLSEHDHRDLRPVTADFDAAFFRDGGLDRVRRAVDQGALPRTDITGLRVGAPIARPGVVLCIGMNYAAHAAESGATPPGQPVLFYKSPNTVVGPYDTVLVPRGSRRTDWEVELAVVLAAPARYLDSPEEAAGLIAGYAVSNDVSERAFQLDDSGGQWSKGKSCETFNPLGPWLVTPDEVGDPQALGLRSRVNGEPRQDSRTADMIFPVHYLIYHLSQYLVLEPGDLVNTGTPEGVALSGRFPYLAPGDVVEMSIDGLGAQRTPVAAAG
ncbi:fumarylacetoacetate hydrolase family protein [Micromonospora sp. WMMD882]|uniref:fumarylacetoacetate hydrolase family protein n=1 Tax=Micromonospora sp. WMMD882 TaxID=3015151 RepID=UPI00248C7C18|nr:fumarylacetoacetate hydrolase family protein [Micromonospora sp. WMMD882]WBB80475.1 fumarylacetoacetate hydrolase family protein [Micromonospora sp. WMMD882]